MNGTNKVNEEDESQFPVQPQVQLRRSHPHNKGKPPERLENINQVMVGQIEPKSHKEALSFLEAEHLNDLTKDLKS